MYTGVSSGIQHILPILENDRPGAAVDCVGRSQVGARVVVDESGGSVRYTPPEGFVGLDSFYYVTELPSGERARSEVIVRSDRLPAVRPIADPLPDAAAPKADDDRNAFVKWLLPQVEYGDGLDIIRHTVPLEIDVVQRTDASGFQLVPPIFDDFGDQTKADVFPVWLKEGLTYRIAGAYLIDELPPFPAIFFEIPILYLTDSSFAPIRELCRGSLQFGIGCDYAAGSDKAVDFEYVPRESGLHNLFVSTGDRSITRGPATWTCEQYGEPYGCRYEVLVELTDDNPGDIGDPPSIRQTLGSSDIHGIIEVGDDIDWFRLSLYPTDAAVIEVHAEQNPFSDERGPIEEFRVALHDGNDILETIPAINGVASLEYTAPESAGSDDDTITLYVGVLSTTDRTGGYRVESNGGDVPGDIETHARLSLSESLRGRLNRSADQDYYSVFLVSGVLYRATITSDSPELTNPQLSLLDERGEQLLSTRTAPTGIVKTLFFRPVVSGNYFLDARVFEAGQNGFFRIAIAEAIGPGPEDDYAGDDTTQAAAGTYVPISGAIEVAGDSDWFRFYSFPGPRRTFTVDGVEVGAGPLRDLEVRIVDGAGETLATGTTWTERSRLVSFEPPAAADYYLVVEGGGDATGHYLVHSDIGNPQDSRHTWAYVGPDADVQGYTTVGDGDWYRVPLRADTYYRFHASSEDIGSGGANPVIRIYDPTGAQLLHEESGSETNSAVIRVPMHVELTETADYLIGVYSRGRTGGYRLTIVESDGVVSCAVEDPP